MSQTVFSLNKFQEKYDACAVAYMETAAEEELVEAFSLAREGLAHNVAIGDLYDAHRSVISSLSKSHPDYRDHVIKAEGFFLDALGIYDMMLRGRQQSIQRLREEIEERQKAEEELRAASQLLASQRDALDLEVRRRTEEIARTAEELRQTNTLLVNASREQAEFTYALSHDLKSPSNTIFMLLEILLEDFGENLPEEAIEILQKATDTTGRMGQLIEDTLSYAQTLEKDSDFVTIESAVLVREILADLESDIIKAAARIEIGVMPPLRHASRLQMRMLFQNLISNAVKFRNRERSLCVTVNGRVLDTPGNVEFTISDTGIGIAPEYQQKVFGLFQRLHLHKDYPGSGLGLALCKRIVANHGGEIRLTSVPGKGSTFTFTLDPQV